MGSCTVHRAFEGIAVGGIPIPPIDWEEEVKFGRALEQYAKTHGLRLEHGSQWRIRTVAALRVSSRTGNDNLAQTLALADPNGNASPIVDDAFCPGTHVVLDDAYLQRLVAAVRDMPGGERVLERLFVISPIARVRVN